MAGNGDAGERKVGVQCKSARASRRTSAAALRGPAPEPNDKVVAVCALCPCSASAHSSSARQQAFYSALAETGW